MRRALVLVGHGSHLNAQSSAPVFEHAAAIRRMGVFEEVLEAFWKEEPSLRDALDLVAAEEVYVVPLFLAEGYFTRQVLPRELGLTGESTERAGRRIHYCRPVGTHESMAAMIRERAHEIAPLSEEERHSAALVVIGHGTERSATSGGTVYRLVETLNAEGEYGTVTCGFLDEEPRIFDVLAGLDAPTIVMVPFFVAEGWHTADTIPEELGLTGSRTTASGATVWYSPPVGTHPRIADVVIAITEEAGAFAPRPSGPSLDPPIARARAAFFTWLAANARTESTFLDLAITPAATGFELRHRGDLAAEASSLYRLTNPRELLAIARHDAAGNYRPLRTRGDLRAGWILGGLDRATLWDAISLVYPAAILHWHLERTGTLAVVDFHPWSARQTGAYSRVGTISVDSLLRVIDSCCGPCLRTRRWAAHRENLPGGRSGIPAALAPDGEPETGAVVPCREPCTIFGTTAREVLEAEGGAATG